MTDNRTADAQAITEIQAAASSAAFSAYPVTVNWIR